MKRMNRRTILLGGAGIAGAGLVGYGGILAAGSMQACVADETLAALSRQTAIASLGARYLVQAPALERAELLDIAQRPAAAVVELAGLMAARAKTDFESGDVVSCDGWVLARGEARACALISLTCEPPNDTQPLV